MTPNRQTRKQRREAQWAAWEARQVPPQRQAQAQQELARQRWINDNLVRAAQLVPQSSVPIPLRSRETALYDCPAHLREVQTHRLHAGTLLGPIGIGGSIPVWAQRQLDEGTVVITTQRVLFLGPNQTREFPLAKIVGITPCPDGIILNVAGRQKTTNIVTGDPIAGAYLARLLSTTP